MLSKRRSVAAILLILGSCGPGDAPYRFYVGSVELQLEKPGSLSALGNCTISPTNLHIDIGLMKDGDPGMQSIPRHLVINPYNPGWNLEISQAGATNGYYAIRLRGTRPQELQFQPGTYRVAVTGYAHCSGGTATSKRPFVYYSVPQEFAPGREVSLVAEATFAGSILECNYNPSSTGGFAQLTLPGLPAPGAGTPPPVQLLSPTAPSLSGDYSNCTSANSYLGPVPNRGKYFVRLRDANNALKCYKFEGTGENTALTHSEITPCPATGSLGI
jgi:hypothetical protein